METNFEGIWVPIITPFSDGQVDHPALAKLAGHLAAGGVAGLVVGATTGEGALLLPGEQEAIFATLRQAVPQLPLLLGVSHGSTQLAAEQARRLSALAPEGFLVTPPVYVRPSQEGVRRHFEAIVEAADRQLLIYNIPYRCGVTVEVETIAALARDPRIVGIKECGGSIERLARLIQETPLRVFSGEDHLNFPALCLGGHGTIAASAHLRPELHVRMFECCRQGRLAEARDLAAALQALVHDLFAEPNPAPLKSILASQGWCANELRLPFVPASADLAERLLQHWEQLPQDD